MEEMIELTNGKKTIIRSKVDYEANINQFTMRGFKLVSDKIKEVKEVQIKQENVVKLKPIKTKRKKQNEQVVNIKSKENNKADLD